MMNSSDKTGPTPVILYFTSFTKSGLRVFPAVSHTILDFFTVALLSLYCNCQFTCLFFPLDYQDHIYFKVQ